MIIFFILILIYFITNVTFNNNLELFKIFKKPIPKNCFNNIKYDSKLFNFNNSIFIPKVYEASVIGDVNNRRKYKFNGYTILNKEIIKLLQNFPIKKKYNDYKEIYYPKRYNPYSKVKFNKIKVKDIKLMMLDISMKMLNFVNEYLKNNYLKYNCNKAKECRGKIINISLIKLENINYRYRITMSSEIHIKHKSYSHIIFIQAEIINSLIYINKINLIGNRFEDIIRLLPGYRSDIQYTNIYTDINQIKYNAKNTYLRDSNEVDKIIKNDNYNNKILKKKNKANNKNYTCIGKIAFNKSDCESNINELKNEDKIGIWDKKCEYNNECPFYQKNKNYPNRRGGCIKGYCELPIGLKALSYRKYNKKLKPMCYNCKKGYTCCEQQKNKKIYPKLKSPDYIFKDDYVNRKTFKKILSKRGLNIL